MPIYAYRCEACGFEKDVLQKLSDAPLKTCESCGQDAMVKKITAPAFQLKGTGWYVTDFRDKGGKGAARGEGDGKSEAGKSEGGAAEGAKPEGAPSDSKSEGVKSDGAKSGGGASEAGTSGTSKAGAGGATTAGGGASKPASGGGDKKVA